MFKNKPYYILLFYLIIIIVGCEKSPVETGILNEYGLADSPSFCTPQIYSVNKLLTSPHIDGIISEKEWGDVPWSSPFVSEIKNGNINSSYNTKFKIGIRNDSIYFSAIVFDNHIWAVNDICQSYFFDDNFLELYIDIDEDEFDYVVFKINALGNLCGEYRQTINNKPLSRFSLLEMSNARCAVFVDGTLNNPDDIDKYWSVECAIPLDLQIDAQTILKQKNIWNVNVQRTFWSAVVVGGLYKKMLNPETGKKYLGEKWVWSFLDENSIHSPELWGEWHFNKLNQSAKELSRLEFERQIKWELRNIYYAQNLYHIKHHKFALKVAKLKDVGLDINKLLYKPEINGDKEKFEAIVFDLSSNTKFIINQYGKLIKESNTNTK